MKAWAVVVLIACCACTSSTRAVKKDEPKTASRGDAPAKVAPRPVVTIGALRIEGSLAADAVEKNVQAKAKALESCYGARLADAPALKGSMSLSLQVNGEGKTIGAQIVDDDIGDVALATCVVDAGRGMGFGAPSDGQAAYVKIPLVFATK